MSIQSNIAEIRGRIAAACAECGRDPKEITLVGASKMNDAAACREAVAAGIDALGENRVPGDGTEAGAARLRRRPPALHRPPAAQQSQAGWWAMWP